MTNKPVNIDEYITAFPKDVQEVLQQIRATVKRLAPDAEETISYAMPTFKLNKTYLVYFAAFKNHIGFYALPSGNEEFKKELVQYKTGKGSIQFSLDKPMPIELIEKIVRFRIEETSKKVKTPNGKTKFTGSAKSS